MCPYFVFLVLLGSGLGENQQGLVVVQTDEDANDSDTDVNIASDENTNDIENLEVFQPTSEWQAVLPGQSIPAGLHVRMNLQTGKKEAKLMDSDDGSRYRTATEDPKQKFITIDKHVISKQNLKEALKDFRDKFHNEKPQGERPEELQSKVNASNNYRSIEEIRKELEGVDLFVKKDVEIIKEHVQVLNSSSSSLEQKEHALDELEYYVHQIDNARDLDTIGGLSLVIRLMNSTEESLKMRACYVLGSAAQSNPYVQQASLKQGVLSLLLRLLLKQEPIAVRKKAMYALSAFIRLFYPGQEEFLKLNGLETLRTLCEEPGSGVLAVKVVTLMTDLLTEQTEVVKMQLEKQGLNITEDVSAKVPLLRRMVEMGWCKLVPTLLHTTENDIKEKVLLALHVMVEGCKTDFKQPEVHGTLNKLRAEWLHDANQMDTDDSGYVVMLARLVTDLMNKLS